MRLFEDTLPEARETYLQLLAGMAPGRKAAMVAELYACAMQAATAGVRSRMPGALPEEAREALARLVLGDELAVRFLAVAGEARRAVSN